MSLDKASKRKRDESENQTSETVDKKSERPPLKISRAAALDAYSGTGSDLATSIQTSSLDTLRVSLSELRNLTSLLKFDEVLSPSDKRIQLAREFCQAGGVGHADSSQESRGGLLNAWDVIDRQEQLSLLPLPLFALSNIIVLLGAHQPTHDLVDDLIHKLLPAARSQDEGVTQSVSTNTYWTRLQLYLSKANGKPDATQKGSSQQNRGASEVVTLATLRLLLEMTSFAGGKYARSVFDHMNWTLKSLPRLLAMRRRAKFPKKGSKVVPKQKAPVSLDRPDIRTLWILFLFSFLRSNTGSAQPVPLQISALSLGRDFLPAILKGLINDPPQIVTHVLMALHDGLLSDEAASRLPRSKVAGFFSEWACKELVALYDRESELIVVANSEERHSIADVVHHFLLALCTHPGRGVCFVDQGWYGRNKNKHEIEGGDEAGEGEEEEEEDLDTVNVGVYNKILLGLLKSLSPTRSPKQAELTLRILAASQELLAPFLNAATGPFSSSSMEPRGMSIAWLSTATLLGRALSVPLLDSSRWKSLPPSLDKCLDSVLPTTLTKAIISRGISQKDVLTRHGALVLLSKLLTRLHSFDRFCQKMSTVHDNLTPAFPSTGRAGDGYTPITRDANLKGEYETSQGNKGPWMKRRTEVIGEARLRLPDLTAILSAIEIRHALMPAAKEQEKVKSNNGLSESLEAEKKPRQSLLIMEAAMRAAKLHHAIFLEASSVDLGKLLSCTSLIAVKSANEQNQSEADDSSKRLALVCQLHAIQLLTLHSQGHAGVIDLFVRQSNKEASHFCQLLSLAVSPTLDQVRQASRDLLEVSLTSTILFQHNRKEWKVWQYALSDSSENLLQFLDESIQRCLKTSYKYIEAGRLLSSDKEEGLCASPILFTMIEQYAIRLQNSLFSSQSIKLEFLQFLARLLPALLTLLDESSAITRLCEMIMDKIEAAVEKSGDKAREEIGSVVEVMKRRVLSVQIGHKAFEGSRSNAVEKKSLTSVFAMPTLKELNKLALDWTSLLRSRVERNIALTYCRNALLERLVDLDMVKMILNKALICSSNDGESDEDTDAEDLSRILLSHEDILRVCRERRDVRSALLHCIVEAALDPERQEHVSLVHPLLEVAVDEFYGKGEGSQTDIGREDRKSLLQAWPFLDDKARAFILGNETEMELLLEAMTASTTSRESRKLQSLDILLVDQRDIELVNKSLLLLQRALKDSATLSESFFTNKERQERFSRYILSFANVANLDDSLCSVLVKPTSFSLVFWIELCDRDDLQHLVTCLPNAVAGATEAVIRSLRDNTNTSDDIDSRNLVSKLSQKLIKACVQVVFDTDQSKAVPLAQVCDALCVYLPPDSPTLLDLLVEAAPDQPVDAFRPSAFLLAANQVEKGRASNSINGDLNTIQALLDKALLWLVRRFAEDRADSEATIKGVEAFTQLLQRLDDADSGRLLKSYLAEPVLSAAIANRLDSSLHVRLVRYIMKLAALPPAAFEKFLADVLRSKEALVDTKSSNEITKMISEAVQRDSKLCKGDLVTSAIRLYGGSLSTRDRRLLVVIQTFEEVNKTSVMPLIQHHWLVNGNPSLQPQNEIDLGILSRMTPNRLYETWLRFPRNRGYEALRQSGYEGVSQGNKGLLESVYDPVLVLSIVGELLASKQSVSGLQWLELARTNALGVVVCCLSSRSKSSRCAALAILTKVHSSVQSAQFQEKDNLLLILDSVRNCYRSDDVVDPLSPCPLPLTTTLFAAHSLRSLGIPSLYLYPLISRFLLQRPTPDPTDVPLLYNFLYSSAAQSTTYKAERMFILRFLATCIKFGGNVEWNILKRRHVWDSICSLYTVRSIDTNVRRAIEDIFLAVIAKRDLVLRIVVRHAFLNFGLQVLLTSQSSTPEEREQSARFWVHCVAEILENVDLSRLEEIHGPASYAPFTRILAHGVALSSIETLSDLSYSSDLMKIAVSLAAFRQHPGATELSTRAKQLLGTCSPDPRTLEEGSQDTLARKINEDPKAAIIFQRYKIAASQLASADEQL
ncbi:hypothetical protein CBS101457_006276 [Exobasidium rhododendri]|nr:hypothetical protein CBS101457_006276 [Exobasidium rhododendri]